MIEYEVFPIIMEKTYKPVFRRLETFLPEARSQGNLLERRWISGGQSGGMGCTEVGVHSKGGDAHVLRGRGRKVEMKGTGGTAQIEVPLSFPYSKVLTQFFFWSFWGCTYSIWKFPG